MSTLTLSLNDDGLDTSTLEVNISNNSDFYSDGVETGYPCTPSHYYHCSVFVLSSVIFIAGVLGNVITVLRLCSKKHFRSSSTFLCINILAVCDLTALLELYWEEMISEMFEWDFFYKSKILCAVNYTTAFSIHLLGYCAMSLLAYIRYRTIVHPLENSRMTKPKTIILIMISTFLIIASGVGVILYFSLLTSDCYTAVYENSYFFLIQMIFVVCTAVFLVSLHCLKVRQLRKTLSFQSSSIKSSIKTMNSVVYIVITIFIVTHIPFVVCDLAAFLIRSTSLTAIPSNVYEIIISIALIFYMIHHAVNPYIYFVFFHIRERMRQSKTSVQASTSSLERKRWKAKILNE